MARINISLALIGHMPANFNPSKIKKWKSSVFNIAGDIEKHILPSNSDGPNWEFTDKNIAKTLPNSFQGDFLLAIVNVPLEGNWYTRRLDKNRIVLSFFEVKDILTSENIPLENLVLRVLYSYLLIFKRHNSTIPLSREQTTFTHDETRGCLFDMNGIKSDIIYSCHKPIICPECTQKLHEENVSEKIIQFCKNEAARIKKYRYYRIADFIKTKPIWSFIISFALAIIIGVLSSLAASFIYAFIR